MLLITRRRLLGAMALSPLLWQSALRARTLDPTRIICLEWLTVELMMALGMAPMAAAELHNYRIWVREPALPPETIDVGLRTEPNLELLTQLKPSLILHSTGYGPTEQMLSGIAPTMAFSFNNAEGKPLTAARESLLQLGQGIGRLPQAQAHLAMFDDVIAQTRARLAAHQSKPVLLISLLDNTHVMVFGKNSLFLDVMERLGLENAWQGESTFWGSAVVGIERLADLKDVDTLCFAHDDERLMTQVAASELWQSLSFIREQRFHRVPAVWFYGATISAMAFCRHLERVLEA